MIDPVVDDIGDPRPRNHMQGPGAKEGVAAPTFAEYAFRPSYVFAGLAPYIDCEAKARDNREHSLRARVKGDWFITSCSNALGNACCQPKRSDAQASVDRAVALCETLDMAVAAMRTAIGLVARNLDLPEPPFASKPGVKTDGPRRLRRPVDPGE